VGLVGTIGVVVVGGVVEAASMSAAVSSAHAGRVGLVGTIGVVVVGGVVEVVKVSAAMSSARVSAATGSAHAGCGACSAITSWELLIGGEGFLYLAHHRVMAA